MIDLDSLSPDDRAKAEELIEKIKGHAFNEMYAPLHQTLVGNRDSRRKQARELARKARKSK